MQDISLAVKVDKRQVKDLKTLIGQVEKQVGALNKVKVTLDTTKAVKNLEELEKSAKKLINALGKPGGIRAVKNSLAAISDASGKVSEQFRKATTAAERQSAALGVLALRFKALREEGRSLVLGGAGQTAKGQGMGLTGEKGYATGAAGSIENIIKDLSDLPRTLAASKQQFAEIDLLLENSVAGSKAFNLLAKARKDFLERELIIREQIKRQQTPMPADPFGTKVPLLPAAGQTSGKFSIQESNEIAQRVQQNVAAATQKLQIEQKITQENAKQARINSETARKRLENIRKIRRQRIGKQLNEQLLGAGFPLLFGGGAGAVGGSILGGAIGAPLGAAFGGQIFGSAIGQTLENSLKLAVDIGNAVETLNLDALEESGIRVNGELEYQIQLLREAGDFQAAQEKIQEKVAEQTGAQGDAMQDVANAFNLLGAAVKEFFAVTSAFLGMLAAPIAALLAGVIKAVNEIIKQLNIVFSLVGKSIKKIAENEDIFDGLEDKLRNVNGQFDESIKKAENLARQASEEFSLLKSVVNKQAEKVDGKDLEDKISNNIVDSEIKIIKLTDRHNKELNKIRKNLNMMNAQKIASTVATKNETHQLKKQQISNDANLKNRKLITSALEKADEAQKKISQTLQEQIDKQLDQVAFENEYAELIMSGSLPAAAKRALGLKQYLKDLDRQFEKEIDVLDTQIAQLRTQTVENAMTKEQLELLDELIEKRDKLEKKKKDAEDAAKKNQGPKSDAKRIEEEMVRVRGELNNLIDPVNQVIAGAQAIGDAFAESFKGLITGSMSAQEALANLFQRTADHFADMAAQMIAKQIQMKILGIALSFFNPGASQGGSFAGVPNSTLDSVLPSTGSLADAAAATPLSFANGGYASGPTRALVGEGGQGEYVIPESKMRESMARYSRGARGSSVVPETGASGTSGEGGGVAVAAPIDVRYSIERINNIDYVTNDQFQQGLQQAAAQGAQRGEQNTLKRLQMSGSTRRRLGM